MAGFPSGHQRTDPAPIALFVYNRPERARQAVACLLQNPEAAASELHVFSDGPKDARARSGVWETRRFLQTICGFRSVSIVERDANLGLSRSILQGVGEVVERHGRVIVLEDDLVTSPFFLGYMNEALATYESLGAVVSVHGYVYPVRARLPEAFFLRGADCWGWATWRDRWRAVEWDGRKLLGELTARGLGRAFDFDGGYPFTQLLVDQVAGRNDSWGIRWHASAFLRDKLTLYPGRSLVRNVGTDSSGTHCGSTDCFDVELSDRAVALGGVSVEEDREAWRAFREFFLGLQGGPARLAWRRLKSLLAP